MYISIENYICSISVEESKQHITAQELLQIIVYCVDLPNIYIYLKYVKKFEGKINKHKYIL